MGINEQVYMECLVIQQRLKKKKMSQDLAAFRHVAALCIYFSEKTVSPLVNHLIQTSNW